MKKIRVTYYALLRKERGLAEEVVETEKNTVRELFDSLKSQYRFTLSTSQVKAAINSKVVEWDFLLKDGDEISFILPTTGG